MASYNAFIKQLTNPKYLRRDLRIADIKGPRVPKVGVPRVTDAFRATGAEGGRIGFKKGSDPYELGDYIYARELPNGEIRYRVAFKGKEKLFKDKNEAIKHRDNLVSEKNILVQKELGNKKFINNEDFKKFFIEKKLSDKEFANFLNEQGYVTDKKGPFTDATVHSRRMRNDIPSFIQEQRVQNVSEKGILKRAENIDALNPNTGSVEKGELLRQYKAGVIPDLETLLNKVQQRENTVARTERAKEDPEFRKTISERQKKSMEKMRSTPEGLERLREIQRKYRAKVATEVGAPPPPKDNKERFWLDLYQTAFRGEKTGIDSAIKFDGYVPEKYPPMNIIKGTTLIDSKTGEKLTFKNIKDFINEGYEKGNRKLNYDQTLNEYDKKVFFQKNQDLKDFFGEKMAPNYERGSRYNPGNIHHPFGRFNDPYYVQFTFFPENKKEASLKKIFDTEFNEAKTLTDKKKVFKNYINELEGLGIQSGFNQKLYGERPTLEEQMTREGFDVSKDPRAEQIKKLKFETPESGTVPKLYETIRSGAQKYLPGAPFRAGAATADYLMQNYLFNMPAADAAVAASTWLVKNPQAADAMGKTINAALEGKATMEDAKNFIDTLVKNTNLEDLIVPPALQKPKTNLPVVEQKESSSKEQEEIPSYSEFEFKKGGRVGLKQGGEPTGMYYQEIPDVDPEIILQKQIMNEDDPVRIEALQHRLDMYRKQQAQEEKQRQEYKQEQKEQGVRYLEDFPTQSDYFKEVGKQLASSTGMPYLAAKLTKGVIELPEWVVGQTYTTGKAFAGLGEHQFYHPVAGEKIGLDKAIKQLEPKKPTTGILNLGEIAEFAGGFTDPLLLPKLGSQGARGIKSLVTPESKSLFREAVELSPETVDPARRDLIKMMGVGAAAAALEPALSKFSKVKTPSKVVEAAEAGVKVLPKVSGMPEWFPSLVSKIEKEGKFPTKDYSTVDNVKVKELVIPSKITKGKDETYIMTTYPNGKIEIHADIKGGAYNEPFELHYTPPESFVDEATGKVIKEPGDFSVVEQRPRPVGGPEDADFEFDWENLSKDQALSDIEKVEQTVTGKIADQKAAERRAAQRDNYYNSPYDDITDRFGDAEIEYDRMRDAGLLND